jgi:predicted regulator of Ras-like GTPase activity (Roadblock/LC7/MglB family)
MSQELSSLRTIAGVDGSFLFSTSGELWSRDLASFYTTEFLATLQNHILQMFKVADQYIDNFDDLLLSYREKKLYIRRLEAKFLCVITMPECDLGSLRMGCKLLIKQTNQVVTEAPVTEVMKRVFSPPPMPSNPPPRQAPPPPPQRSAPPRPKPPTKSDSIWG